ncbi:hypothetical protein L228DRAFT_247637 [Xylona heveae TC161]|uniref:Uncharacterized protein n=1 Tax=Xylona heveae (strain CBS 132557 / TC161) TaxID=1328760 RepID=A0A165GCH0_XYLHT|nr:hypothetical protein L228DRAFT_247637 [Xylona heveae TC161]KZF22025.1 hypothetical protein L228DRAFT_247637 [Xylona heveae TC161]
MRIGVRLIIAAVLLIAIGTVWHIRLYDLWDQNRVPDYIASSFHPYNDHATLKQSPMAPQDKVVVMTIVGNENVDWVKERLIGWQAAIYDLNNATAVLKTPANKGHEAMAYLTYVIDHYDSLPSTIAFMHPHLDGFFKAWHVDTPHHDNAESLNNLQIDFIQRNGYANLRCNWNPGCLQKHRYNKHVTPDLWATLFGGERPPEVASACCAQFAVSRDQVHKRPREDYIKYRQWVLDTPLKDYESGRVMEYSWHVIFGMDPV